MPRAGTRPSPAIIAAKVERWLNEPGSEQSISALIARRLAAGEVIVNQDVAAQYRCSTSLINLTVHDMRIAGYRFEVTRQAATKPGAVQLTGKGNPLPAKPPVQHVAAVKPAPAPEPTRQPHPALGQTLKVRALALGDDDMIVVMLTDGNGGAWQCRVVGST
jgi:hypothetical protein